MVIRAIAFLSGVLQARKSTAGAISSGVPQRPMGVRASWGFSRASTPFIGAVMFFVGAVLLIPAIATTSEDSPQT